MLLASFSIPVLADYEDSIVINGETKTFNRVIYIAPNGNDQTGDGTKANPYATYYKAESVAQSGNCIFFEPGEYILDKVIFRAADPTISQQYFEDPFLGSQKGISVIVVVEKQYYTLTKQMSLQETAAFLVHGLQVIVTQIYFLQNSFWPTCT